jgi:D-alanyl-D-alanine carboxypeptidase/D-alanyl-D-alanine-endopeptidase (penicillin-binding protein 4)
LLLGLAASTAAQELDSTAPASDDLLTHLSRRLSGRLKRALGNDCLANARTAVVVRELETGQVLFRRNGALALVPASNQKLLTAAAALTYLGSEHSRSTRLKADRRPDAEGAVGTLYFVGKGDPSLNVEALYLIARTLASQGVRKVDRIVADDSYFSGPLRVPSWPERNHHYWYGAPAAALSANYNVVAVHARAPSGGGRPDVWVDPFPGFFDVSNSLRSGRGPLSVGSRLLESSGTGRVQRLDVSGRVRPGRSERVLRAVENPALFAAHGLQESLRRVGIEVASAPREGLTPPEAVLLHAHASKPLALLLHDMNKQSSNVFAETLLQVIGAELVGLPGSREKGLAVLEAFLGERSRSLEGLVLEDGSGLSPDNRIGADALTDLILAMSRDRLNWPEFLVTLPVSGVDGTLRRRLKDGDARRLVRAKTGRLGHVVALSGLAPVGEDRTAVFSILVNDYPCPTWKVQDAVDALVRALTAETPAAADPRSRLPAAALDGVGRDGEAGGTDE